MSKVTQVFTYQNGRQVFTVPNGYDSEVTYHCWGGGGGAGGDSNDQLGGNGSAGTYIKGTFLANPGDQIQVIVGGGGTEGSSLESNKKIYSCEISGTSGSGVGPTASYGYVTDPTKAVYPEYSGALKTKTYGNWNAFMNAWAVSNLPDNRAGTEEVTNSIYFPEAGSYTLQASADNSMVVTFRNESFTVKDNFGNGPLSKTINVPSPGVYELSYVLTNLANTSGNPAGAAIVITRPPLSSMGPGSVVTYPGNQSLKNVIWSTRYGPNVEVTNRVPLCYAPVVDFYQPQNNYTFDVPNQCMAFINVANNWTESDLALLNLNFSKVIAIGYPVTITGTGAIDQVVASGYYVFKRGQTWDLARYNWTGNQNGNANLSGRGTFTPNCWTEKQWYNDNNSGRTQNAAFAKWELPVPGPDVILIVGYADGVIYNAPSQRGSNNVKWTVTSTTGQSWAGGAGGKSATNVSDKKYNYYGGYGGQIGSGKTSGGGGGGGGATTIIQTPAGTSTLIGVCIAGGGAGGGGAGFNGFGNNASNEYVAATAYPNSIGAGQTGQSSVNTGGGGGGGGGGCDGGKLGLASTGGGQGSGGDGGFSGGSQVVANNFNYPPADFVMVGRGGDGGIGGGGGGGAVETGQFRLKGYQYIQVGGTDDAKFEGGASAIWFTDTDYIVAGPGGRGGRINAAWAKNGGGQPGGCINENTGTNLYNGSGGGAGTGKSKSTATGGPGKGLPKGRPAVVLTAGWGEYYNSGGASSGGPSWSPGGGGGAGGAGQAGVAGNVGGTGARGGNGGLGKTVSLGKTGRTYTLGGGGGASAGYYQPGPFVGLGQAGGGDGASGIGPEMEFTKAQLYTIWVPRGVTTMYFEGVGAGAGGGTDSVRGAGGGGAGAYISKTAYTVTGGQQIDITIGPGGASGATGGNTIIRFYAKDNVPSSTVTLQGGKPGASTGTTPLGGAGGSPNGQGGGAGGQGDSPNFSSGSGGSSPYGEGGGGITVTDKNAKPGVGGRGAGGGGGRNGVLGGRGGDGYLYVTWSGSYSIDAQANSGSGGGGGFDDSGGAGGTGFVAIAYPGKPQFEFRVGGRAVTPIQQNGYTIHECRSSGELIYKASLPPGTISRGNGVDPQGTNIQGYVPGSATGGIGQGNQTVFPCVRANSYPAFLNDNGVWESDPNARSFNREYMVYFPTTASYDFKAYVDNGASVKVDDGIVLDMTPADRDNGAYWYKNGLTATKKISAGLHKITIQATNLAIGGAFAMTVTQTGTSNVVFNARTPPVASGGPNGGNGLVILEFTGGQGTAKVKVNNSWNQVIGQWIKVDNVWKPIINSYVKVNGAWKSLFGAQPLSVTVDPNGFGGPANPGLPVNAQPDPPSTGGGGGGGCKIICTALHEMGLLPDDIYQADEQFGEMLRTNDPAAYWGYVKWASVVVDWMEGSGPQCMFWIRDPERRAHKQRELAIRWAHRIATPWAQHMAYRMGTVKEDSRAGRWIMRTGLAISRTIGKLTGAKEPTKSAALGYAMWAVFAVFWLMAGIRGQ